MRVGNKKIFHLEAWVIKVMRLIKVGTLSGPIFRLIFLRGDFFPRS